MVVVLRSEAEDVQHTADLGRLVPPARDGHLGNGDAGVMPGLHVEVDEDEVVAFVGADDGLPAGAAGHAADGAAAGVAEALAAGLGVFGEGVVGPRCQFGPDALLGATLPELRRPRWVASTSFMLPARTSFLLSAVRESRARRLETCGWLRPTIWRARGRSSAAGDLEAVQAAGFLDRVEVLALAVLDEHGGEDVVGAHARRGRCVGRSVQRRRFDGGEAAVAGDDERRCRGAATMGWRSPTP
jgi:hypothetical protein